MTQQRIPYVIQLSAAATVLDSTLPILDLDYRFAPEQNRVIAGSCTGADTITVMVSPVPRTSPGSKLTIAGDAAHTSLAAHTGFFVTVSTYSGVFYGILDGPWAQLKAYKTGTSGAATLYTLG